MTDALVKDLLKRIEALEMLIHMPSMAAGQAVADGRITALEDEGAEVNDCLLYTSPSPRDRQRSRMPSSA